MLIMSWIGIIFSILCLCLVLVWAISSFYDFLMKDSLTKRVERLTKENSTLRGENVQLQNELDRESYRKVIVWGYTGNAQTKLGIFPASCLPQIRLTEPYTQIGFEYNA